ncbi:MAG: sigma-70 family RNA polymerase sigma factor [Demequinaceae bacterium]|nr:sigma-70 family RNA polymerase sigma factor [Demequinaceae bacterium]
MGRWSEHLGPLMETRYPALLAYANALTAGDRAQAEDVVQDAIVRSFSRGRGFETVAHSEAYTRRAILSVFLDKTRSRSRLLRAFSRLAEADATPSHDDTVDTSESVRTLLRHLSPRERACVVLRYYDDLTIAQVADALGLASGTVKRYLSNATSHLGAHLGLPDDPDSSESVAVSSPRVPSRKER